MRKSLRLARQALTLSQQDTAANRLLALVRDQAFFRNAQQIAFYSAIDGELDPGLLLELALSEGKSCFLPVITSSMSEERGPEESGTNKQEMMSFAPYESSTQLSAGRYGIAEPPLPGQAISPADFDLVLVPLVGFSADCFRLGMGKGFYDRTFSFKISNRSSQPFLLGLAHECQLLEGFPVQSWDVQLDAVATAEKIHRPHTARAEC